MSENIFDEDDIDLDEPIWEENDVKKLKSFLEKHPEMGDFNQVEDYLLDSLMADFDYKFQGK